MLSLQALAESFESYRISQSFNGTVPALYAPAQYLMDLGGKRMRPLATLVAHQLYQHDIEFALPAALAVEVFHNFSLMHDDIMDESPLRRDSATVHMKFDLNSAILSGDWMLIHMYEILARYDDALAMPMIRLMNTCAREVCEGQQRDINFESTMQVADLDYIDMIRDKTAVLLGAAFQMGGLTAFAADQDLKLLYQMGLNAGLSFQLKDDYLDAFSDLSGKIKGGDILQNKKTLLFIQCMKLANPYDREELLNWYQTLDQSSFKIERVLALFEKYKVGAFILQLAQEYGQKSIHALEAIQVPEDHKANARNLLTDLLNRNK